MLDWGLDIWLSLSVVGTIKGFYLFLDIILVVLLLLEVDSTLIFVLPFIVDGLIILLAVPSEPVKAWISTETSELWLN